MPYELPALPYAKEALEPHFDALTMEIHHGRHHKAYVDNLNKAIAGNAALEAKSLDQLIGDLSVVPDAVRGAIRNNGGGHWNHSFFWNILGPNAGGVPTGCNSSHTGGSDNPSTQTSFRYGSEPPNPPNTTIRWWRES